MTVLASSGQSDDNERHWIARKVPVVEHFGLTVEVKAIFGIFGSEKDSI